MQGLEGICEGTRERVGESKLGSHYSTLINYSHANKFTAQRNELEDLQDDHCRVNEQCDIDIKETIKIGKENKRLGKLCKHMKIKHEKEKKT